MRVLSALAALVILGAAAPAWAVTITVSPADSFEKIEAAQAGDTVRIEPGTYKFRVYLDKRGSAAAPIVIEATDPSNPPVWDLEGQIVDDWPGSYGGGDKGRGCWQVVGSHYRISGIVFKNCRNESSNAAGIRTNGSTGLVVRDCVFTGNDNGFTGQGEDTAVEFCELGNNGNLAASAPTHNIYVYGGTFALRYSYVHDPVQGQNFHIRARDSVIEYNWFARAKSYEGDLMTSDFDSPPSHKMLFRGNVVVGNATPDNGYQVIALFNDTGSRGVTMDFTAVWNTFVIQASSNPRIVHLLNDSMENVAATISNNLIVGTTRAYEAEVPGTANYTVSGSHNWLPSGADSGALIGTVSGADPGFVAPGLTLAEGSPCIGAADAAVANAPLEEYFKDETVTRRFRHRAAAKDIGAFESTTVGADFGPYDDPSSSAASSSSGSGATSGAGGGGGAGGSGFKTDAASDFGCGCRAATSSRGAPIAIAAVALGIALARRRRSAARRRRAGSSERG